MLLVTKMPKNTKFQERREAKKCQIPGAHKYVSILLLLTDRYFTWVPRLITLDF